MVIDKLPFDKYELEPSPLTQFILERKSPQTCWQASRVHAELKFFMEYRFSYILFYN